MPSKRNFWRSNPISLSSVSGSTAGIYLDSSLSGGSALTIASGTTLSGTLYTFGTYNGGNGGSGTTSLTNNGTLTNTSGTSGTSGTIFGNATTTNNGTISGTTSGGGLIFNGTTLTNAGTLQVNAGSTLALNSTTSTQTAGATIDNGGAMAISNSSENKYNLQGGALYGTGTISGNLNNTGAKVSAGTQGASPTTGTLALTGNYTQTAGATFSAALGGTIQGTQYDFFTVSGTTILGGYLDVDLINSFLPTLGETFQIIKDNGSTGAFSNVSATGTVTDESGAFLFQVLYSANGVMLTSDGGVMPEPGAGSLLLVAVGPGALYLARRRKQSGG